MTRIRTVLAAVCVALLGFAATPAVSSAAEPRNTYELLDLFGEVFERVRGEYVEEVSEQQLIESAIQGMLRDLDPHSVYLSEKHFQSMREQTRGQFGGLGIEVTMDENGFVRVVAPIDDTPAYRAGIQAGDLITALDGDTVQGMTLNDAVELMRGEVGSEIRLTIVRDGQDPFDVTIVRDRITIRSVRSRIDDDVGYIRISSFTGQTQDGLEEALNDLLEEGGADLKGFVLDLRSNPGGLLDQAISVTDTFLDKGEIVSTRGRNLDTAQRYQATSGDKTNGLPIVVLINSGSASASEIVAGALQDHGRAIVMGTQSFGKGSVQTIMPMGRGDSAIKLTTQRYYTPSGRSIQQKGIAPDIVVERARLERLEPGTRRSEATLRGALENDQREGDGNGDQVAGATDLGMEDYQLARALDLIRGISLYRTKTLN